MGMRRLKAGIAAVCVLGIGAAVAWQLIEVSGKVRELGASVADFPQRLHEELAKRSLQ